MTREQARKWFQSHMTSDPMVNEAFRMAIEALQREEAEEKGYCHRIKPKQDKAEPKWSCTANFVAEQLERLKNMTDEDEMKVLDNILFRCWQMGWLDKYDDTKNQTRWTPCSERLPEESGSYLVTSSWGKVYTCHYYADHGTWQYNRRGLIEAWQPLPKPYREDGER